MEEKTEERVSTDIRILTEETFERLAGMIRSSDPENHKIAQLILVQVDVQKSIYWLWRLAKINAQRMVNLRTKLGRKLKDDAHLFGIAYKNNNEFASWLERKGWLTEEYFQLIVRGIRSEIKQKHTNKFYDFHITIKDEFKSLDKEDKLTPLNDI